MMGIFMKGVFKMDNSTAKEKCSGLMEMFMKENFLGICNKEKENYCLEMVIFMKEIFKKGIFMEMECIYGKIMEDMKANLPMDRF